MQRAGINALIVVEGGDVEGALRRLKRENEKAGVWGALAQGEHYVKPGERRRIKSRRARKRVAKKLRAAA